MNEWINVFVRGNENDKKNIVIKSIIIEQLKWGIEMSIEQSKVNFLVCECTTTNQIKPNG